MNIKVNETLHEINEGITLTKLLEHLGQASSHGIAIAVDQSVVPKNQWDSYTLLDQSEVLLIQATKGG